MNTPNTAPRKVIPAKPLTSIVCPSKAIFRAKIQPLLDAYIPLLGDEFVNMIDHNFPAITDDNGTEVSALDWLQDDNTVAGYSLNFHPDFRPGTITIHCRYGEGEQPGSRDPQNPDAKPLALLEHILLVHTPAIKETLKHDATQDWVHGLIERGYRNAIAALDRNRVKSGTNTPIPVDAIDALLSGIVTRNRVDHFKAYANVAVSLFSLLADRHTTALRAKGTPLAMRQADEIARAFAPANFTVDNLRAAFRSVEAAERLYPGIPATVWSSILARLIDYGPTHTIQRPIKGPDGKNKKDPATNRTIHETIAHPLPTEELQHFVETRHETPYSTPELALSVDAADLDALLAS